MTNKVSFTREQAKKILDFPWGQYGITMTAKSELIQREGTLWEVYIGVSGGGKIADDAFEGLSLFTKEAGKDSGITVSVLTENGDIEIRPN